MFRLEVISFVLFLQFNLFNFHFAYSDSAIPTLELPQQPIYSYESPSQRFLSFHGKENILSTLKSRGLSLEHRNFFEHLLPHEELGFFGYHSSKQGFRIFQDIIRMVLEEVCDLEIKNDFHFLRIPGLSTLDCENVEDFFQRYPVIWDNAPEQRDQLLSINFALFGNFQNFGECSIAYFTMNRSIATIAFQEKLKTLFEFVELPLDALPLLFNIGKPLMEGENAVLYQFFDLSHYYPSRLPYDFVNSMCFASREYGVPYSIDSSLSEVYLNSSPHSFPMQMRLLINHSDTLNPYSPLFIKRYDRLDTAVVQRYENELREAIRNLSYHPEKAHEYRELLLALWGEK